MDAAGFVRARIRDESDAQLAAHIAAILWQMCELAASIDAEWGCSHGAANLFHNRDHDEWDGPVTSSLPIDCVGAERLAQAIGPLARVWADHPDFRAEWGIACDRCHAVAFDVRPHHGFNAHGIPCGCDPVPLCGDCLSHHNEEFLASVREIRANRTRKILGPPVPGAADTRFTFTTSEAGDALRDGGA
jgi:hypothetical protein